MDRKEKGRQGKGKGRAGVLYAYQLTVVAFYFGLKASFFSSHFAPSVEVNRK